MTITLNVNNTGLIVTPNLVVAALSQAIIDMQFQYEYMMDSAIEEPIAVHPTTQMSRLHTIINP